MIRTLNEHDQDGLSQYMIVGGLQEIAETHILVGRTRVLVISTPTGLTLGDMVTVCAHRRGDQYVADAITRGLPARTPSASAGQ
jgi:hypothetical protein